MSCNARIPMGQAGGRERHELVLELFRADPKREWSREELERHFRREMTRAQIRSAVFCLVGRKQLRIATRGQRGNPDAPTTWILQ
jgi:hypothetical protein